MTEFVRELLASDEQGYTRAEIKERLLAVPEFAARLNSNPSGLYGIFSRLRDRDEIVFVGDRCYPSPQSREDRKFSKAPVPKGR